MGEDDIVELLWKSGQVVRTSQTQRPSSNTPPSLPPPPILRGSGSGNGEENAPLPLPQPSPPLHHQNLFILEDEMSSWLHHSHPGVTSTPASSVSLPPPPNAPREDDIVELLWQSGQVVGTNQTHRQSYDPPPILRGSGSGRGEENAPLSQPPPHLHQQNLFIQEGEMYSWLHHSYRQNYFCSELLNSTPATHPQSSISLAPRQTIATRRAENFMNFSWLRGNIFTGGRVDEAGPSFSVVRESMQVGSNTTPPSSSATESCVIPATEGTASRVSGTLAAHDLGRKGKAVAVEAAGTPSSGVCKAETEPVQIQPATESKLKAREETHGTEEARGSTSRKRSRTAEMHNLAERRRREKINEKMKTLQQLIPRCNKSTKVSTLDDAIEYVKSLQSQIQIHLLGRVIKFLGR